MLYLGLFGLIGLTNTAGWVYAALLTEIVRPGMGRGSRIMVAAMNGRVARFDDEPGGAFDAPWAGVAAALHPADLRGLDVGAAVGSSARSGF